jgi:hypothetical protein
MFLRCRIPGLGELPLASAREIMQRAETVGNVRYARTIDRYSLWLLPVTAVIVFSIAFLILWS